MSENKMNKERYDLVTKNVKRDQADWDPVLEQIKKWEKLYDGDPNLKPIFKDDPIKRTAHVRNMCQELIEAQIDPNIPQPKVSVQEEEREDLAKTIEDKLRNELDRLPMETLNDLGERIGRIDGGYFIYVEWDSTKSTPAFNGQLSVQLLHPRQFIPQKGVYTGIQDMDHMTIKMAQTKQYIKSRYGVDVSDCTEQEPEIRGHGSTVSEDIVTVYIYLYRNENGGIGRYVYTEDIELEDIEDYQARHVQRCKKCGEVWTPTQIMAAEPTKDGKLPDGTGQLAKKGVCPYCHSKSFTDDILDYEEVYEPITVPTGVIPGATRRLVPDNAATPPASQPETTAPDGLPYLPPSAAAASAKQGLSMGTTQVMQEVLVPTYIPYYKPNMFPVALVKNISHIGQLLGESDVARIEDQQNTANRLSQKINDMLMKSGSYMTVPNDSRIPGPDGSDMKPFRVENVSDMNKFAVFTMQGDISQLLTFREYVYEEARQQLGITDSYQGRKDVTATSGVAKQFSAAQTQGRLESKLINKNAAYADVFQIMFKFLLAYADEERPVVGEEANGKRKYSVFRKYDFLEKDPDTGEWFYNADPFLFSVDDAAPLANNRQGMWQEGAAYYQAGAFGDPTQTETQLFFWEHMDDLHYPCAAKFKVRFEEKLQREQQMAQRQQAQAQQMQQQQMADAKAQQDAENQRANAELIIKAAEADNKSKQTVYNMAQADRAAREQEAANAEWQAVADDLDAAEGHNRRKNSNMAGKHKGTGDNGKKRYQAK